MSRKNIAANIRLLKELNIQLIGVGGHDSSDDEFRQFANEFADAYLTFKVGKRIDN